MNDKGGMLIYDGDCRFCTTSANWIAKRWSANSGARAVAWQLVDLKVIENSQLALEDLERSAWWIDGDLEEGGSRAVGRALMRAGGTWALLGRLILVPPVSWIAPIGYGAVVRFRHRLPGGTPACKL